MNDLQKDQAIYQAMLEIAEQVFNEALDLNEGLRALIKQYGGFVTLTDLCKSNHEFTKKFDLVVRDTKSGSDVHKVNVDTFSCSFPGNQVFDLLKYWKSLANVKSEQAFFYEEKIENEFAGSVEVVIPDGSNAKLLVKHVANDELRPVMNFVLAEINATRETINFVASDGHSLAVISNNQAKILEREPTDIIFQALFMPDDWKRLCDYAKKNGKRVLFDIYHKKESETYDTFNVHLGDICLRSLIVDYRYPNWQSVIPTPDRLKHHFDIVSEDRKAAQEWLKRIKAGIRPVNISFYRGSDLVYFDYDDYDFSKSMTATFRLTRTSDVTIGVAYSVERLQRIKFTGFNIEASDRVTIVNCEEADLVLLCPVTDDTCNVRDVENREVHLQVWPGIFAKWHTLNGDYANVRVEAVNTENGTASIRTKGWNRYKVDINDLSWNYCEEYTFPSWVCVGQFIQSEAISGIITDVTRSYVTLDNHQLVSYKDLFACYYPVAKSCKAVETQAA